MTKLLSRLDFGPTGEDIFTFRTTFSLPKLRYQGKSPMGPFSLPGLYCALYAFQRRCCCCAVLGKDSACLPAAYYQQITSFLHLLPPGSQHSQHFPASTISLAVKSPAYTSLQLRISARQQCLRSYCTAVSARRADSALTAAKPSDVRHIGNGSSVAIIAR